MAQFMTSPLDLHKLNPVIGTTDPSAFLLSLRGTSNDDISTLHSYGIHSVPHIGVYGANYSIALPLVLLSVPPSINYLKQLPVDILNALNINISDIELLITAKELVQSVLLSALSRNNHSSFGRFRETKNNESQSLLNGSTLSGHSIHFKVGEYTFEEEEEGKEEMNNGSELTDRRTSFMEYDLMMTDCEEMIRCLAKKLVRKVLRTACEKIEERRSSLELEYLINNTKRMKIGGENTSSFTSLSPPLSSLSSSLPSNSLLLEPNTQKGLLQGHHFLSAPPHRVDSGISLPNSIASSTHSSSLSITDGNCTLDEQTDEFLRKLGKRRQRSESHDATLLRERRTVDKLQSLIPRISSEPILEEENEGGRDKLAPALLSTLTDSFKELSIMEEEKNNEEIKQEEKEEEEEYIILEAITKPVTVDFENIADNDKSSSSWTDSYTVPKLEYYIIVHSYPPPGECQKFLCSNTNEINLVFHCWLHKEVPFNESITVLEQLSMGVFEPQGIAPVHLDLKDAGLSFHYLEERTVCIHNCCFSPENAQLQLQYNAAQYHTFFSVASHHTDERKVITFHVVPSSESAEQHIRENICNCNTLRDVLTCFEHMYFPPGKTILSLLNPLFCT